MTYHWSMMVGCVQSSLGLRALAAQVACAGLRVKVKKRAYPNGGHYIHIYAGDDFTLGPAASEGYLAEGLSTSVDRMYAAASRVSSRLTKINVRHWFAVHDEVGHLVHYLHHIWPPAEEAAPGAESVGPSLNPDES
jgi:hypothetical protein